MFIKKAMTLPTLKISSVCLKTLQNHHSFEF